MRAGDDGDDAHAAALELLGDLDGHDVAAARGDDERAVLRREIEVAQDAFSEPAHVFEEHRLPLAVRADDEIVKGKREFDDRIEAGKRTVTRPHFLDHDP